MRYIIILPSFVSHKIKIINDELFISIYIIEEKNGNVMHILNYCFAYYDHIDTI